jgi:hypothetical protein
MLHAFSTNVVKVEKVWPARFPRRLFIWDRVVHASNNDLFHKTKDRADVANMHLNFPN